MAKKSAVSIIKSFTGKDCSFHVGIGYRQNKKKEGQFHFFYGLSDEQNFTDETGMVGFDGPMFDLNKVDINEAICETAKIFITFIPEFSDKNDEKMKYIFLILMEFMEHSFWKVTDFDLMLKSRVEQLKEEGNDDEIEGFRNMVRCMRLNLTMDTHDSTINNMELIPANSECNGYIMDIIKDDKLFATIGFGEGVNVVKNSNINSTTLIGMLYSLYHNAE